MKKISLIIVIIFLIILVSGILSPPKINYWINVSLPGHTSEVNNITLILPIPIYKGYPFPFYTGTFLKEIYQSFEIAGKVKNVTLEIQKNKKFGYLLKIYIPKLSLKDTLINTNKLDLNFPVTYNLPYLPTPFYYLIKPRNIFFLSGTKEYWYFIEKNQGNSTNFQSTRHLTANFFVDFQGENIAINFGMRVEKKIFFGKITVEEKTSRTNLFSPIIITSPGWKKVTLYGFAKKSFL